MEKNEGFTKSTESKTHLTPFLESSKAGDWQKNKAPKLL
jgi:hypothetical protein